MTNGGFNPGELKGLAEKILGKVNTGREFMLDNVCNQFRRAYDLYPEDPVIRQAAYVLERKASNASPGATISQADITEVYNAFVDRSGSSVFRQVLGEYLLPSYGQIKKSETTAESFGRTNQAELELNPEEFIGPDLANGIASLSDDHIPSPYDKKVAQHGTKVVSAELEYLGIKNAKVEIMGGNSQNIIYAANFETPKGQITIAIPTEVSKGHVLFPSKFVANKALSDLTAENINKIINSASPLPEDHIFGTGNPASVKAKAGQEVRPEIEARPEAKMPKELSHLARDFEDSVLEAASSFGLNPIRVGKETVANEMSAAGFKGAQVKFGSENDDSVIYLVAFNTPKGPVEIEVPVEMKAVGASYAPLAPSYFAYDGLIEDFTSTKLQRFAINLPAPSAGQTVYSSAFAYMTLPELRDEIVKAVDENDYVSCESALAEIQDKFSDEDYKNTVADYHHLLVFKTASKKENEASCPNLIPAGKTSVSPICGCLGVPVYKVVAQAGGKCRLKTSIERENLNPAEDGGAAISTSKINFT